MPADVVVGIFLGLLMGVISGAVALVLLKTANTASVKDVSSLVALTTEILAIPTFWFGGPWVSTSPASPLKVVSLEGMIGPYVISVAITFTLVVGYPISRWVIHLGEELARTRQ